MKINNFRGDLTGFRLKKKHCWWLDQSLTLVDGPRTGDLGHHTFDY